MGEITYSKQKETFFSLEEKLRDPIFQDQLKKRPYIWGASQNGRYLVTLAYNSDKNMCQLDLIDIVNQKKIMGFVFEFIHNNNVELMDDELEQIRLVEQALQEAYHIELPVTSSMLVPYQKRVIHGDEIWWVTPKVSDEVIQVLAENRKMFRYVIFEWINSTSMKIEQSFFYQVQTDNLNHLVVFIEQKTGEWEVMIRPLDEQKWNDLPSEELLTNRCIQLLFNSSCKVIYRDPVSFRFYLMGSDNWESKFSQKGYISYIKSFVLFNQQGELIVLGNSKELKDAKGTRMAGSEFYRIYLDMSKSDDQGIYLLIDGFDSNYQLLYSHILNLDGSFHRFE